MTIRVRAVYEKGVLVPREPRDLPEHAEVEIEVRLAHEEPEAVPEDAGDPTDWETMRRLIGMWKDAPPGEPLARDHDEYLYGARRRTARRPGASKRQP